jgi:hypothetical protein
MRRLVSGLWLILLLASPFAGQTDEWKKYKSTDGNFTVLFPGDPQDTVNNGGPGITSHTLQVQQKPAFYMIVWTSFDSLQAVNDTNFEGFKNGFLGKLPKCEIGTEQPASPALQGYIGQGYRLNCEVQQKKIVITGNLYWGKHYCFAVMSMFPADMPESAEVKRFIESFGLIDPAK